MKDWIKKTIAQEDENLNKVKIAKNKIIIIIMIIIIKDAKYVV